MTNALSSPPCNAGSFCTHANSADMGTILILCPYRSSVKQSRLYALEFDCVSNDCSPVLAHEEH